MDAVSGVRGQGSGVSAASPAPTPAHAPFAPPARCPTCGRSSTPAPAPRAVRDADAIAIAPYEPEVFSDLVCAQPAQAAARLRALSASACTRQALAHVAWLADCGISSVLDEVLADWSALLAEYADAPCAV